ncbi:hypothetical protein JL720_1134 [Aureococcus anophagefferens]|nr:hypothetical protein JL720_1134 [Aureococcus anophagefferens]
MVASTARVGRTTFLGFGSLLSEQSARLTFPDLDEFRLVRVRGYRRVFGHAASIFFERGIADAATKEFSSLSAEPCADASFVACAFEVDVDADADAAFVERWGRETYERKYLAHVPTIWDWSRDSGLRPCACYLRHCVLAVTKAGPAALDSFLDDTYLVDRETTLRTYLGANPHVMDTRPPESLIGRYSG